MYTILNGAPGDRVGNIEPLVPAGGFVQKHQRGAIYWRLDLGAWWVFDEIYERYLALGGAEGPLGFPVSGRAVTGDGTGGFSHFEFGSIYWHPLTGAFEVRGGIRAHWQALGAEAFGYPVTNETSTQHGRGCYNDFWKPDAGADQYTSIYWSPATDAHAIYGGVKRRWLELGGESSYLGFPVTDEMDWTDPDTQETGRISHFEFGAIAWISDTPVEFPERRILRFPRITQDTLDGWAEITLTAAGSFHFHGHVHNGGFLGTHLTYGIVVKIPGTDQALVKIH
ncbi:LGFP repeat-containing protein, partial [Streptomyces albidoflavus]